METKIGFYGHNEEIRTSMFSVLEDFRLKLALKGFEESAENPSLLRNLDAGDDYILCLNPKGLCSIETLVPYDIVFVHPFRPTFKLPEDYSESEREELKICWDSCEGIFSENLSTFFYVFSLDFGDQSEPALRDIGFRYGNVCVLDRDEPFRDFSRDPIGHLEQSLRTLRA